MQQGVKYSEKIINPPVVSVSRSAQLELIGKYSIGKICPFTQRTVNIKNLGIMLKVMVVDN